MEYKETLGHIFVLSELERLVDRESKVFSVCFSRLQLVDLVGLDPDSAVRVACP